jgi:hypothetical protein
MQKLSGAPATRRPLPPWPGIRRDRPQTEPRDGHSCDWRVTRVKTSHECRATLNVNAYNGASRFGELNDRQAKHAFVSDFGSATLITPNLCVPWLRERQHSLEGSQQAEQAPSGGRLHNPGEAASVSQNARCFAGHFNRRSGALDGPRDVMHVAVDSAH